MRPNPSNSIVDAALRQLAAESPLVLAVDGSCMEPALRDGTKVEVARARFYLPGDVLAFRTAGGELRVHRLIGYRWPRRRRFQTRADASGLLDEPIGPERVIGRVVGDNGCRARPRDRARALYRFCKLALLGLLPK